MVCWIPFWIIVVLRRFFLVATMPRNVELLCMFLLYFSNIFNPFVYAGMNPSFKREFHKIVLCERKWRDSVLPSGGEAKTEEVSKSSEWKFWQQNHWDIHSLASFLRWFFNSSVQIYECCKLNLRVPSSLVRWTVGVPFFQVLLCNCFVSGTPNSIFHWKILIFSRQTLKYAFVFGKDCVQVKSVEFSHNL